MSEVEDLRNEVDRLRGVLDLATRHARREGVGGHTIITLTAEQWYREQRTRWVSAEYMDSIVKDREQYLEDILGNIWLYIDWRYVTKQLTTPQKERFADAVEAWSTRLNRHTGEEPIKPERWWR